ncbi:MAG: outer membrane beta-barrel protein [Pseudomonadota bacterium]|nr:outer membrane beta-barrel protein [Pseudomonadota bacterium]
MLKTISAVAVLLAGSAASPALAQAGGFDRDSHFNGPYVQVFGGVAAQPSDKEDSVVFDTNGDGNYTDTVTTATGTNAFVAFCEGRATSTDRTTGCSNDKDRKEFGGRIGFDKRMGNIVVGLLVEGSGNDILDGTSGFSSTPASYTLTRGLDCSIAGRARVGFTPNGGALFYATGGVGYARLSHDFGTTNGVNSFTENNDDDMVWGYQLGGGAEVMLTNNISLGLEYLFNRYKDDKYYVQVGQGTAGATNPFVLSGGQVRMQPSSENFTYQSFRATLGFRF